MSNTMYKINGRTRKTQKRESGVFPMASGACWGRLAAPLWSRCPSVISLTLGGASPSRCARRRRLTRAVSETETRWALGNKDKISICVCVCVCLSKSVDVSLCVHLKKTHILWGCVLFIFCTRAHTMLSFIINVFLQHGCFYFSVWWSSLRLQLFPALQCWLWWRDVWQCEQSLWRHHLPAWLPTDTSLWYWSVCLVPLLKLSLCPGGKHVRQTTTFLTLINMLHSDVWRTNWHKCFKPKTSTTTIAAAAAATTTTK